MRTLKLALLLLLGSAPAFGALTGSCIWSVIGTGNANYGGYFDPSQTAGMLTNATATAANTASPVVSSASYNFVASDVGDWLFVASGTNWTPGFYKIASVASNQATLDAAIGHGILYNSTTGLLSPSTVAGCATTASPTTGTFSVDYAGPGQATDSVTNSTFASVGSSTTLTDGSSIFTPVMVGNAVHITGAGTGSFGVLGWYTITAYTNATTVTTDRTTNSGTAMVAGTAFIGGAVNLLDTINSTTTGLGPVAGNQLYLSGSFTQANTLTWVPTGTSTLPIKIQGYVTYWGDATANFSRTNGSGAIVTTGMPVLTFSSTKNVNATGAAFTIFDWLDVPGNISGSLFAVTGTQVMTRCVITNSAANVAAIGVTAGGCTVFNCDILMTGATTATTGISATNAAGILMGNRIVITSPTGFGASVSGSGPVFIGNQFIGAGSATATAGAGIETTNAAGRIIAVGNTFVGFYDGTNSIINSTALSVLVDNMLTDCADYGINGVGTVNAIASFYNRTGNNTAGAQGNAGAFLAWTNYGEVTSWSTSDYQNVASDLRLKSTSPAVGTGWFPVASIGALQLASVAGGQTYNGFNQ
jgi:hypothetical protein